MHISVIICTHNPREDYLKRTLEALEKQSMPKEQWELLLIDNASAEALCGKWDASWHSQYRIIREEEVGLTYARLRGIKEAKADIVLFVDDDNILDGDYLENAIELCRSHPFLGAVGGRILPEYEVPPPSWFAPHEHILAIRRADAQRWSNVWDDWMSQPCGAGMVVRREVCQRYVELLENDPRRTGLGRSGNSLFSGEDTDLVMTCLDLGLGYGVFPELQLTHLIPPERTTEAYLLRLIRALTASNLWLKELRGLPWQTEELPNWYTHLRGYYHFLKRSRVQRKIDQASFLGQRDFREMLIKHQHNGLAQQR